MWLKVVHTNHKGVPQIKKAKLNLVDLAGSERHGKTGKFFNSNIVIYEILCCVIDDMVDMEESCFYPMNLLDQQRLLLTYKQTREFT